MSRSLSLLLLFALTLIIGAGIASAEKVEVSVDVENFRKSPNGKILATVNKGTDLQVLGTRGRWYKVQITGWVWRPQENDTVTPTEVTPAPQGRVAQEQPPVGPVEIKRKQVEWLPQDFHRDAPPQRAHLRIALWFQNQENFRLNAVQYLLELVNGQGQVLHSEEVERDVVITNDEQEPHSLHLFVERGGPSGELYRRLRQSAEQGGFEVRVTLKSAFFSEAGRVPLAGKD